MSILEELDEFYKQAQHRTYAGLASDHLRPLVAALDDTARWYHALAARDGKHTTAEFAQCSSVVCKQNQEALAALQRDIEALKGGEIARATEEG